MFLQKAFGDHRPTSTDVTLDHGSSPTHSPAASGSDRTNGSARTPGSNGSNGAVSALADHEPWLRKVVVARSGDPQAVEEIVQEVALAVVRSDKHPTNEDEYAPWLYRIAVRQSLLHRRRLGRRARLERGFFQNRSSESGDAGSDPLEWLLADERRDLIRRALAHLSRRDAEILLLKYTEDWTYARIAEHTGTTISAVEARLHRARARLRKRLAALNVIERRP